MGHQSLDRAYQLFILELRAQNLSPRTIEQYEYMLPRFFKWLEPHGVFDVAGIKPIHIKMHLAELVERELSGYHIYNTYSSLRKFFNVLVADEILEVNPVDKVKKPIVDAQMKPAYTADEIKKLMAACCNNRDKTLIATLAGSGLRIAEALALDWSDISFSDNSIRVQKGKWRQSRKVYVSARTMKHLLMWRIELDEPDLNSPVFTTLDGYDNRLSHSRLFKMMRWLCKRAKVERKGVHAFRRYYALESAKAGVPLPLLCRLMGIKNVGVLIAHYLPFIDDDVREAAGKVDPLRGI
ncbi:MAG: site-specific integrase [Caldilineaceae bacterium]